MKPEVEQQARAFWNKSKSANVPELMAAFAQQYAQERDAEVERKYYELIMAVESKFPNESRHETALRYINEREHARLNSTETEALKEKPDEQV